MTANLSVSNTSKFVRRVLRNGLLYTIIVFIANLYVSLFFASPTDANMFIRWIVLELEAVLETGIGATLPLAVVLIGEALPAHQLLLLTISQLCST